MAKKTVKPVKKETPLEKNTSRLSQSDVPSTSLDKALTIAKAIIENYGGKSATPLQVARALNVLPTTGPFRMITGASVAYGLTKGGYNTSEISVEPLAKRIFKPTNENDDLNAKIEAFLKPRVIKEFFNKYNGSAIPREDIAKNVLEEMGVPNEKINVVYDLITKQGENLGIIVDLKSKKYVELGNRKIQNQPESKRDDSELNDADELDEIDVIPSLKGDGQTAIFKNESKDDLDRKKKVFITHGKNTKFIEPIKKLLSFGELQAVVSVEKTTISQPVPDKVLNDMRSCGAAIIHVEEELKLVDEKANPHSIINANVLIEIGAAMALFGRRFILLVKDGIKLPSNLQGLFEVRYTGDELDGSATIKLLEAINDIKNQTLPN